MLLQQQLAQQKQLVVTTAALAEGTMAMCRRLSASIAAQQQELVAAGQVI
jgi:predicted nucleic acid-binding protein